MDKIEKIRAEIERRMEVYNESIEKYANKEKSMKAERDAWKWAELKSLLSFINSLPDEPAIEDLEKAEFPTTDEEVEKALASIQKVKLPDKYKTPDWLFKQQEHPQVADASKMEEVEVNINKEIHELWESLNTGHDYVIVHSYQDFLGICLHCFELGLNARKL